MGIHKISSLIDTAEVRKAHALTGDDLAKKQVNDSDLAKISKVRVMQTLQSSFVD